MSRCGRTHQLESLVSGELSTAAQVELGAHAQRCVRCRHELQWLQTERRLFQQRASREEVAVLWKGVALHPPRRPAVPWTNLLTAVSAAVLLMLGAGRVMMPASNSGSDAAVQALHEPMSVEIQTVHPDGNCSRWWPGTEGFRCGGHQAGAVLASR